VQAMLQYVVERGTGQTSAKGAFALVLGKVRDGFDQHFLSNIFGVRRAHGHLQSDVVNEGLVAQDQQLQVGALRIVLGRKRVFHRLLSSTSLAKVLCNHSAKRSNIGK
jgi:hypothetical protein